MIAISNKLVAVLLIVCAFAQERTWAASEMKVFGHDVAVLGAYPDERLVVDGKPLVKEAIITIDQTDVVSGVGVLIGGASNGGNACDAAPFVVSFPKGEAAKVDGPIEQCGMGKVVINGDRITFDSPALPNIPGRRHTWTVTDGFKDDGEVPFSADHHLGWDALRRHQVAFPLDLYRNTEVGAALKTLTGDKDQTFVDGLLGPSSGEFVGDLYVGSGCVPHSCQEAGSFLVVERGSKRVFVAWKESGKPFVVRPPVGSWPSVFRYRLKEWTKTFH